MAGIIHLADHGEQTVAAIRRAHGITETTFARWRQQYGDLT
ncbi:MAG: helix-turn-helix domain-containing protein, partial [Ktedonobacterales bacterium]